MVNDYFYTFVGSILVWVIADAPTFEYIVKSKPGKTKNDGIGEKSI